MPPKNYADNNRPAYLFTVYMLILCNVMIHSFQSKSITQTQYSIIYTLKHKVTRHINMRKKYGYSYADASFKLKNICHNTPSFELLTTNCRMDDDIINTAY